MKINLCDCLEHMSEEEKDIYSNNTATELFEYTYNNERFKAIIDKMKPNVIIKEEEWLYLFEKLYLVTYKAIKEESSPKLLDGLMYLIARIGTAVLPKDSCQYNEYYKDCEMIESVYKTRKVDDDLLRVLSELLNTKSKNDLQLLLNYHQEACRLRNNRDYMYREILNSTFGEISEGERVAINCFNRSYNKSKKISSMF